MITGPLAGGCSAEAARGAPSAGAAMGDAGVGRCRGGHSRLRNRVPGCRRPLCTTVCTAVCKAYQQGWRYWESGL